MRLIIVILLSSYQLFSQDIGTTEVKVVEGFTTIIPEATRLNQNATFQDTTRKDRSQEYYTLDADLVSDYQTTPLKPAKVKPDRIPRIYNSKVSLGTGYRVGSKISAVYNSIYSRDISYGIIFNHLSHNVEIDNKLAGKSSNDLHLYIKKILPKKTYIANMEYVRKGFFTYGNGTSGKGVNYFAETKNNPFYNRFSYTKFLVSSINTDRDSKNIIRNASLFVSDLNELSENQLHLSIDLAKKISRWPFTFRVALDNYRNHNNSGTRFESISVQSFQVSPSTSFDRYGMKFDVGLDLDYLSEGKSYAISPEVKVTKELVKDILLVYSGLSHKRHRNTFKSLSDENPYIHSYGTNQSILYNQNIVSQALETTDKDELYFGMRNLLSKKEVLHTRIGYAMISNLAHFILVDNIDYKRFQVNYIETVWQLHANVSYSKEINDIISISANADYFRWDQIVYHKPDLLIDISSPINLRDKIVVKPSVLYKGKRNSLQESLSALVYANLSIYYSYSKQLSAYLELNNITSSEKQFWNGYREVGFNGVVGLNYSF